MKLIILVLLATVYFKVSLQEEKTRQRLEGSDKDKYLEKQVSIKPIPYLAFLKFDNGEYCTGTLISHRYVLTAAHCVRDRTAAQVKLGKIPNSSDFELEVESKRIKTYHKGGKLKGYDEFGRYKNYDIAVIELAEYVNSSELIQPAVLPAMSDYIETQQSGTVAGWDVNNEFVDPIFRVNHVEDDYKCLTDKPNVEDKSNYWFKCIRNWLNRGLHWLESHFGTYDYDQEHTLCTRNYMDGENCAGISGGPLISDGKVLGIFMAITKWEHNGVIPITGTCIVGDYSTFTKVTGFLPWIEQNTDIQVNS